MIPPSRIRARNSPAVARAIESFCRAEDRHESFRVIYGTFAPSVRRFFSRKGFPPEECLDLTQEVFLGIYKGLEGYRSDARFETWLYRVATTTYLKRLRSRSAAKRQAAEIPCDTIMESDPALETPPTQLNGVLVTEQRAAMKQAIENLPDQMRRSLTLRLYQQLSYREIAVVMRLEIDTVKAHLFQARRRLTEELRGSVLGEVDSQNGSTS